MENVVFQSAWAKFYIGFHLLFNNLNIWEEKKIEDGKLPADIQNIKFFIINIIYLARNNSDKI